jgi:hypothetical protein
MISSDTPSRRPRRSGAPAAAAAFPLPLALVLALAGCPAPEPAPDTPGVDRDTPADWPTPGGVTLTETCSNREYGFQVEYPSGWEVNEANGLPPCSAFDPGDASMPAVGEIPRDIAIVIHRDPMPLRATTAFEEDPTVEVVSRQEMTVDGRRAVVAELQHTGQGMYPAGDRQYTYYVDLDAYTLMAMTHGIDAADPPPYQERQRILDEMMSTLRLQEPR